MQESDYFAMNRQGWDLRTEAHLTSRFYDVAGFKAGNSALREIERAELTDVRGKRLLHLQCHFGLDTLSWVREGAICTGVDISPAAIKAARNLADELALPAEFVCTDVYSYQRLNIEPFDIVFSSYGAICWLPDLTRWAEIVASNLAPDGRFYLVEFHPIYDLLAGYSYFTQKEPDIDEEGTYTENGEQAVARLATWAHPLSRVLNALIAAGIRIECVNEYPFSPYNCFANMQEREPGRFYLSHQGQDVPIVYSIRGRKLA